jgi:hypothetical protein
MFLSLYAIEPLPEDWRIRIDSQPRSRKNRDASG